MKEWTIQAIIGLLWGAILCYTILYYTILYYTILYYTILYYTILYYTILYYTILYYTILYYTILYYTILYYTILYYTILYYTILYYTILYYTILYYTILYCYSEIPSIVPCLPEASSKDPSTRLLRDAVGSRASRFDTIKNNIYIYTICCIYSAYIYIYRYTLGVPNS